MGIQRRYLTNLPSPSHEPEHNLSIRFFYILTLKYSCVLGLTVLVKYQYQYNKEL